MCVRGAFTRREEKKLLRLSVGPRARGRAAHLRGIQEAQEEGVDAEDGGEHLWSESVVRRRAVWSGTARVPRRFTITRSTREGASLYPSFSESEVFAPHKVVVTMFMTEYPYVGTTEIVSQKSRAKLEKSFLRSRVATFAAKWRMAPSPQPHCRPRVSPPAR